MQICPRCEAKVVDLDNELVITASRLDDTEIEKALSPSIIVKMCPECGALFVAEEHISVVKDLLGL